MVRIVSGGQGGHGHSHGAPAPAPAEQPSPSKAKKAEKKKKSKDKDSDKEDSDDKKEESEPEPESEGNDESKKPKDKDSDKADKKKKEEAKPETEPEGGEIKVTGYLNLFADAFHNFTDGLAIGASYMAGNNVGMMTTFFILFHEVPHEIGDYAILIRSGMSPMKAKLMQLVTAVAAITGCLVALIAQEAGEAAASTFILPFTAGGFIYIATVSVIPELLEGTDWKQSFLEICGLVVGVGMMVVIAQYE